MVGNPRAQRNGPAVAYSLSRLATRRTRCRRSPGPGGARGRSRLWASAPSRPPNISCPPGRAGTSPGRPHGPGRARPGPRAKDVGHVRRSPHPQTRRSHRRRGSRWRRPSVLGGERDDLGADQACHATQIWSADARSRRESRRLPERRSRHSNAEAGRGGMDSNPPRFNPYLHERVRRGWTPEQGCKERAPIEWRLTNGIAESVNDRGFIIRRAFGGDDHAGVAEMPLFAKARGKTTRR